MKKGGNEMITFNLTEEEIKDLADIESFMACEGGSEGDAG